MEQVFLTIPETAMLLRISLRSAYQLAQDGKLPGCIKVGNQWRVNREQLLAWQTTTGNTPPVKTRKRMPK